MLRRSRRRKLGAPLASRSDGWNGVGRGYEETSATLGAATYELELGQATSRSPE
jgi:hypothetical protein